MSRSIDELELYAELAGLLARPNAGFVSWNGLGKRLRLNDDRPRRAVTRLEQHFRTTLVESRGGRLGLTTAGRRLFSQVEKLLALRTSFGEVEQTETLTVEADDDLAAWLLPRVLPDFLTTFAGAVHLRVCPLDTSRVRANIAAGLTGFGLGFDVGENTAIEPLEPGFGWRLLVPADHRLCGFGSDEAPQLGMVDRVFLASGKTQSDGLEEFLQHLPGANRIECGSFQAVRACVENGHGVGIVPGFVPAPETGRVFDLANLSTLRVGVYRPRDDESLSDPGRAFVAAVRGILQGVAPIPTGAVTDDSPEDDAVSITSELSEVGETR